MASNGCMKSDVKLHTRDNNVKRRLKKINNMQTKEIVSSPTRQHLSDWTKESDLLFMCSGMEAAKEVLEQLWQQPIWRFGAAL